MIPRRRLLVLLLVLLASPAQAYEGFSIPNKTSAAFPAQADLFAQDLQILAQEGIGNGVVYSAGTECKVTAQASPNMTLAVAACTIVSQGATASVGAGNVTIGAANATNPRIDVVSASAAGTKTVTAGTAAATPAPPTLPEASGIIHTILAFVYVPANDTAINSDQITDKRIFVNTPGGGGGAGTGLSYVTKVAEGTLSNEFALGSLATGLLINTTTTGVPTIYAGGSCTNQFVTATSASGALTCTTDTLASAQHANQGTTTTVLHGNAVGNPSFAAVSLTADVSGDLPYSSLVQSTAASRVICRGSAGGAGDWQECDLAAGLTLSGTTLTPGFTASSSDTLTNKTLDAEGTGNVLKLPVKIYIPAAGCDNATAGTVYDQPTSNGGSAACYGTAPMRFGALNFVDGASALTSQLSLHLPSDWDSAQAVDVKFIWFSGSTSTNSVVWTLATSCIADTEDLLAPTFNTAQTVADANLATANTRNSASIASVTMTGCAAGELLFLRVGRDPTNGSDTLAATAALIGIEITLRRSI